MTWPQHPNQAGTARALTLPPGQSSYDAMVLADGPACYLCMASKASEPDMVTRSRAGSYHGTGTVAQSIMPNGDPCAVFDGSTQYLEFPDYPDLSATLTGILTFEAWIRPDTLTFPNQEGTNYVHWMGKGKTSNNNQEWVARMYSFVTTDTPQRPNRISGYCFNPAGGTGVGAFFQDTVVAGQWIHYACTINTVNTSGTYPTGYTTIFKNGTQRNTQSLSSIGIVPVDGNEPMRVGTRDLSSYFLGAIGKVAIYNYELTPTQLSAHVSTMTVGP